MCILSNRGGRQKSTAGWEQSQLRLSFINFFLIPSDFFLFLFFLNFLFPKLARNGYTHDSPSFSFCLDSRIGAPIGFSAAEEEHWWWYCRASNGRGEGLNFFLSSFSSSIPSDFWTGEGGRFISSLRLLPLGDLQTGFCSESSSVAEGICI